MGKNQEWIWGASRRLLGAPKPERWGVGPSITGPGAITVNRGVSLQCPPQHTNILLLFITVIIAERDGAVKAQGSPRLCPRPGTCRDSLTPPRSLSPHNFQTTRPFKKKPPEATQTPGVFYLHFHTFPARSLQLSPALEATLTHAAWELAGPASSHFPLRLLGGDITLISAVATSVQRQAALRRNLSAQKQRGFF